MYLKDLMAVFRYCPIGLYSGFDGKLVAKSRKSLEKFGDVEVLSAYPKISLNASGDSSYAYLYVYGDHLDVERIRNQVGNEVK